MKGALKWAETYKGLSWMKDAYVWANKLGLRPEELSPVPEDGMYELALKAIEENVPRGSTVLDAGAGTLDLAHELAKRGYRVIAVEINPKMLEIGRVYYPFASDVIVVRADFRKLWAKFDAVIMLNMSWQSPLPEAWADKIVITDAWWNGMERRLLVIKNCEVVKVYEQRTYFSPENSTTSQPSGTSFTSLSGTGCTSATRLSS